MSDLPKIEESIDLADLAPSSSSVTVPPTYFELNDKQYIREPAGLSAIPKKKRARKGTVGAIKPVTTDEILEFPLLRGERSNLLVHKYKAPTVISPQQRIDNAKAARQRLLNDKLARFKAAHPDFDQDQLLQRIREVSAANSRYRKQNNLVNRKEYTDEEKLLRKWHSRKPNVMTNPKYKELLNKYRGTSYNAEHTNWVGRTPQTMDDAEYNQMIQQFAEMVGVAHARPKYDPKLLTKASAREIYGDEGYVYEELDMDDDVNTPATLKITRSAYRDANGDIVPERVIAIGGYKIPDATASQTEQLLKNIDYYGTVDKAGRKTTKLNDYLHSRDPFKTIHEEKMAKNRSGFKLISQFIRDWLAAHDISTPAKDNPTFISLENNVKEMYFVYKINSVVWNTLMVRMSQLFAYNYVFPLAKVVLGNNVSFDAKIMAFRDLISNETSTDYENWESKFIFPPLESAILRSKDIQEAIAAVLSDPATTAEFASHISEIVDIVCRYFMNFNFNAIASRVYGSEIKAKVKEISKTAINSLILEGGLMFEFVKNADEAEYINQINAGQIPLFTMTAVQEKTVIDRFHVSYKGASSEYIEEGYEAALPAERHDRYYG